MTATHVSNDQSAGTQQDDFDIRVDVDAAVVVPVLHDRTTLRTFIDRNFHVGTQTRFNSIQKNQTKKTPFRRRVLYAHATHVVIPFDAIALFPLAAAAAVQYFAFEVHVVSRFNSAGIERVAQAQFHYWSICGRTNDLC